MKRRTFIGGTIAAAVTVTVPIALPAETIRFIPPALSAEHWARMNAYLAAETIGARVQASMFISGGCTVAARDLAERVCFDIAGAARFGRIVRRDFVDGGVKITVLEDPE